MKTNQKTVYAVLNCLTQFFFTIYNILKLIIIVHINIISKKNLQIQGKHDIPKEIL